MTTPRCSRRPDIKHIIITGANKGIGLATSAAVLDARQDVAVLLGSRDIGRGEAAVDSLCAGHPERQARVQLLPVDVASDASVAAARERVRARLDDTGGELHALINKAGTGFGSADLAGVVNVNTCGPKRLCDAFLPLIAPGGRIINVSSASAPNFVSQCAPSRQAFFRDRSLDWDAVADLNEQAVAAGDDPSRLQQLGLGVMNAYGFSKACLSLYTVILAQQHPGLYINACTPGYIETDMTRPAALQRGVSPASLGMKPPAEGTRSILHLLFRDDPDSGHYYGSDARRSPLDRYRAPDTPAFQGD